jgi:peroxiredoxin
MISNGTPAWAVSDSRQAPRLASSFRAGTIIETFGVETWGIETSGVGNLSGGVGSELSKMNYPSVFRYYSGVRRTLLPALIGALVVIGLLVALIGCYSGNHPARIGSNAPDFTLQDSDHKVTLSQFRGQVVVLNFWATWCPPCVEETPSLVRMQSRLKDKGVVVLAVSIDADDAAYHKFLKEYSVNMVTVRDEAQKAATLYGTFGWPESYVIDRNGVIRRKFIGPVDWNNPEVTDYLSKL